MGGRHVGIAPGFRHITLALAAAAGFAAPAALHAQAIGDVRAALREEGGDRQIRAFYAARGFEPLWLRQGAASPAAHRLIALIESAEADGLKPGKYRPGRLADALEDAMSGSPEDVAEAELALSKSFALYVQHLRTVRKSPLAFTDPDLRGGPPGAAAILEDAAKAPSLLAYVDAMGWMHPLYAPLRKALGQAPAESDQARRLRLNLARARLLPGGLDGRHLVVDAAGGRLLMYEGGKLRDSMRVIVGKEATPTPMMAGVIRFATLNPYWNVPTDLARDKIAPEVVSKGASYLREQGIEVLSDWSAEPNVVDPGLVDWKAVASGYKPVRLRQRPGAINGMGRVKFTFPNPRDIYLHDTPDKGLFRTLDRRYSAGCVRLENAAKLGRWLYGKPLTAKSRKPELQVPLPSPVPVYITYLTAFPEGQKIAFRADPYGWDGGEGSGGRVASN